MGKVEIEEQHDWSQCDLKTAIEIGFSYHRWPINATSFNMYALLVKLVTNKAPPYEQIGYLHEL
jgi:hypothetical protein